jgi:peroxiredoxin
MTQPLANILLRIEQLLNADKQQEARRLLVDYLQQNPTSARGWWLLSLTLTDINRQVACLQRVLRLDPENRPAQDRLNTLIKQIPDSRSVSPFTSSYLGETEEIADDLSLVPDWAQPSGGEGESKPPQPQVNTTESSSRLEAAVEQVVPSVSSPASSTSGEPSEIPPAASETEIFPVTMPTPVGLETPSTIPPISNEPELSPSIGSGAVLPEATFPESFPPPDVEIPSGTTPAPSEPEAASALPSDHVETGTIPATPVTSEPQVASVFPSEPVEMGIFPVTTPVPSEPESAPTVPPAPFEMEPSQLLTPAPGEPEAAPALPFATNEPGPISPVPSVFSDLEPASPVTPALVESEAPSIIPPVSSLPEEPSPLAPTPGTTESPSIVLPVSVLPEELSPLPPTPFEAVVPSIIPPGFIEQENFSPIPPDPSKGEISTPEPPAPSMHGEPPAKITPGEPETISSKLSEPVVETAAPNPSPASSGQKSPSTLPSSPTQPHAYSTIHPGTIQQPATPKSAPAMVEDESSQVNPLIIARQPVISKPSKTASQLESSSTVPPITIKPTGKVPPSDNPGSRWEMVYILMAAFVILAVVTIAGYISIQRKAQQQATAMSQAQLLQETLSIAQTLTNLPFPTLIPTWTSSPTSTSLATATLTGTATYTPTLEFTPTRTPRPANLIGPGVGQYAPDFNLTDLATGQQVTLSQFDGHPVFIFFWATWCNHCNNEMAVIETISQTYKDTGLQTLTINAADTIPTLNLYLSKRTLTVPILLDPDSLFKTAYKINLDFIPLHFFIDSSGRIDAIVKGEMTLEEINVRANVILQKPPTPTP